MKRSFLLTYRRFCMRRAFRIPRMASLAAFLWFAAVVAPATDYYVRPDGDDNGPGTETEPFATVATGIYSLQPGDTLYIGEGVYYEGEFYPDVNASPDHPITIRNIPGEQPILDGYYELWQGIALIEKDGFIIDGLTLRHFYDQGVSCENTGYITVRNCVAHGNGSAGIALNFGYYPHATYNAHMLIEDNVCYENGWSVGWASGIHVNNKEQGENTLHVIRRNVCYNNYDGSDYHTDGNGIMFDVGGGGACIIENNVCFNNGGAGIRAMDGQATIVNNTCFRNAWDANNDYQPCEIELIERHTPGSVLGSVVRNNVLRARPKREFQGAYYGGVFRAEDVSLSDFAFSNNVLWSDVPSEVVLEPWMNDCIVADALHVATAIDNDLTTIYGASFLDMNAAEYDFGLQPVSPAIDAALGSSAPDHDIDGMPRPWHAGADCGAHEYMADGDCDADGVLTVQDWLSATTCLDGPDIPLSSGCVCADIEGDADVDVADLARFQALFGD